MKECIRRRTAGILGILGLLAILSGFSGDARADTKHRTVAAETGETENETGENGGEISGTAEKPGTAPELTKSCTFRLCSTGLNESVMTDGKYTSYWESREIKNPWVEISSETPMYGLYLCFRSMPSSYEIQVPETDEAGTKTWVTLTEGNTRFYHVFYELEGIHSLRIYSTQQKKHRMGFNELFVFGEGEIPDWVQRWEPTEEKADILFFSAHPDDELIFLGGAIPTYAAEKQKRVVVAYLSWSNTTRRSEALNGLWSMGVRHYPEFGGFRDSYSKKASEAYKNVGGKKKVLAWVTEMYRKHQPEVVVTHDLNGEYGHGQHKMMADAAVQGYDLAADAAQYPDSAAKYGTWQVKKLYVHLYGEEADQTRFDWTEPLESLGGKTGLQAAVDAYALHKTQETAEIKINKKYTRLSVEETGSHWSNTCFGLYASQVGPDETHTDFLEHIPEDD